MKRIISIALVALMLVALALPVIAALPAGSTITGGETGDVKVKVEAAQEGGDEVRVYKVDIAWAGLDFVYSGAKWDPDKLAYNNGTWNHESGSIVVTNSSNAQVVVNATMDSYEKNGVKINLSNASFTLASAADGVKKDQTITFALDAEKRYPVSDDFTVGTITVALSTVD